MVCLAEWRWQVTRPPPLIALLLYGVLSWIAMGRNACSLLLIALLLCVHRWSFHEHQKQAPGSFRCPEGPAAPVRAQLSLIHISEPTRLALI
eukprot:14167845-Alexandrium_andersonii.AAC.1